MNPLVTVLITSQNRPEDLRQTLAELRRQTYRPMKLLVIDDASAASLEPVVREHWPEARFLRNPTNRGIIASRTLGMKLAQGEYVCNLDDDSCFVDPDALERAVARAEREPEAGILSFLVHNGIRPPAPAAALPECYVPAYVGCANMIRRAVIEQLHGYRDFYFYYSEEAEYSLRALAAGWRILFVPSVVVHHRVSPLGRNRGRVLGYSLRNQTFTILLNMPWPRAGVEASWKLATYGLDAVKRFEFRWALWGVASLAANFGLVCRLHRPVSAETLRLYDALRFTTVASKEEFVNPPRIGLAERLAWLRGAWRHRRRARAVWDRRAGGLGTSSTAVYGESEPV